MRLDDFFYSHPIFRYEEFAQYMQQHGIHKPTSWRRSLSYHCGAENLQRIQKKLYIVTMGGGAAIAADPYLVAAKATDDAVLSHQQH